MSKVWLLTIVLLLFSCKESQKTDFNKRHALIVNINSKENLLAFSYGKNNDYAIKIEDLNNNKIIYSTKIQNACFTVPRINNDKLYFPESNYMFACVGYKTKKTIWKLPTKGRIREFQIVKKDIIIASVNLYGLVAINTNTGKIIYELLLHSDKNCQVDSAPRPIDFDEKYFYVTNFNCSSVAAYEINTGKEVWSKKENNTTLSNLIVAGKYLFVGSNITIENPKDGEISLLEAETGKIVFKQKSSFDLFTDPILYQNKIFFHTYESSLNEFDINRKTLKTVLKFNDQNDMIANTIFKINNTLYFQDLKYNINKADLNTFQTEFIEKGKKGLLGVYKVNNEIRFIY